MRSDPTRARAVTFDCWNTLIYEAGPGLSLRLRGEAVRRVALAAGRELAQDAAERLTRRAWEWHAGLVWGEQRVTGAAEMASFALEELGIETPERARALGEELAEIQLEAEVPALEGARETLERLAERGIRRALVCDTGYSPGRVVRQLLERNGLLEWLEVLVFSDEAGVPKPNSRVFRSALEPLGVDPESAVHVGDLRHTDIRGGRELGMGTVRIRATNDDRSEHPEADHVVDSHADLRRTLGVD